MNILFINQYFYPDTAATAQLLTELCLSLAKDHKVTVICGKPSYNPVEQIKFKLFFERDYYQNICVYRTVNTRFSRVKMIGRISNYVSYLIGAFFISLMVKKLDIVVTMTDPPIVGLIGLCVKKIKKVPMVAIINDLHPDIGVILGKLRNQLIIKVLDIAVRSILEKSDKIISIGRSMQKRIIDKGIDIKKIVIISNWADVDLITPQPKVNPFSLEYEISDNFVVMYSGNISLSQNLNHIIDAAKLLKDESKIRFLFIGDGIAKVQLEQYVKQLGLNNVLILPYQPKEMLKYSLSSADIHLITLDKRLQGYIVPSKVYGIMAVGRPFLVLTDESSEVCDIVKEFDCGIVIDSANIELLAESIRRLSNEKGYLKKMGDRGREAAVKYFGRNLACTKYEEIFYDVIKNPK